MISLLHIPVEAALPPLTLALLALFALFFWISASSLLKHRPEIRAPGTSALPALSALLPFTVRILACARLAVPDPSPLFGLAALLVGLILTATLVHRTDALLAVALAAVAALELAWHGLRFDPSRVWGKLVGTLVPALDWFARFNVEPWEPDDLRGHSVVVVRRDGERATGVRALAMVVRCLPLLFFAWGPIALVASFTKRGDLTTRG